MKPPAKGKPAGIKITIKPMSKEEVAQAKKRIGKGSGNLQRLKARP